jgi:hypothetical protein
VRGGGRIGGRPWERRPPRRPKPLVGGAGPAVFKRTCFHYFYVVARRRLRLPPRRRAAPPHSTNACTTACGHQGEDEHPPALLDAPAFELREKRVARTAPPRCRRW